MFATHPAMSESSLASDRNTVRRDRWRSFLVGWSALVVVVVALLWWAGREEVREQVFVLRDEGAPPESFWVTARRNLLLAHLSLSRAYPWLLLAPYVIWAAARFSLEREHLRRHLLIQGLLAAGFVASCQGLNHHLTSGRPLRLIVAVTETSSHGRAADGSPTETVTRLRKELRVNPSVVPDPLPREVDTRVRVNADGEVLTEPGTREQREESFAWQEADGGTGPGMASGGPLPFALFWRGRLASTALDLLVFASLCGLGHAVHYRHRWQEREQRAAALEASLTQARLHALQAQLQPHFLFNTLNSITALVRQSPPAAEEMLTSLGDLLRLALSQATRPWSSLRDELRFLQLYLDLQQMRYGDRLRFEQAIAPELLDCAVPSLLLQPLVENAIRHGIEPAGRPGTVRVLGRREGDVVELKVADDGVGCPALMEGEARPGTGLTNVRERLRTMFDRGASLSFAPGVTGGLVVCIRLPVTSATPPDDPTTA